MRDRDARCRWQVRDRSRHPATGTGQSAGSLHGATCNNKAAGQMKTSCAPGACSVRAELIGHRFDIRPPRMPGLSTS